jgi:hypothetical protein
MNYRATRAFRPPIVPVKSGFSGLQYTIEAREGLTGFCMSPSERLMWRALDVGIRTTFYVVLNRAGEVDYGFSLETFLQSW